MYYPGYKGTNKERQGVIYTNKETVKNKINENKSLSRIAFVSFFGGSWTPRGKTAARPFPGAFVAILLNGNVKSWGLSPKRPAVCRAPRIVLRRRRPPLATIRRLFRVNNHAKRQPRLQPAHSSTCITCTLVLGTTHIIEGFAFFQGTQEGKIYAL